MRILFLALVSVLTAMINIGFVIWAEKTKDIQQYFKFALVAGITGMLFCGCQGTAQQIILCIANATLLFTAYIDFKTQEVYRVIWAFPMAIAGMGISYTKEAILSLGIFFILQFFLFSKFYGKADSFCFCLSAETIVISNGQLLDCLIHMLIALTLMFVANLCKHNVDKHLKLKKPEPFIPYIYIAWIFIIFRLNGGMRYVFL